MDLSVPKLLWFGDIGRRNSFSRISESVLPYLVDDYDITLLMSNTKEDLLIDGVNKIIKLGDPIRVGNDTITWEEFSKDTMSNKLELEMKYAFSQVVYECINSEIKYFFMVLGIYEVNWFMKLRAAMGSVNIKFIVWVPIDYIPTKKIIENLVYCDYLLTMTPTMNVYLNSIFSSNKPVIDWVGHGVSNKFFRTTWKKAYKGVRGYIGNITKKFSSDDIIILNANSFVPRKQIDQTLRCFSILSRENPKLKLWLHTNCNNSEFKKLLNKFSGIKDKIILTQNNLDDLALSYIYNLCSIGLQTSWGEGWSLTNCEHACMGGVQVVPNFLATGFNFSSLRGHYTYDVDNVEQLGESDNKITVGKASDEEIIRVLRMAIDELGNNTEIRLEETIEYFNNYNWNKIAYKIGLKINSL